MSVTSGKNSLRLYTDLAWTWPIISTPPEYAEESAHFIGAIRDYAGFPVETMLDLGCGGGHNDFGLKSHFEITGVDLNEKMLEMARLLNPEINYIQGDMRTVNLNRTFDSVIITDAINYMTSSSDLLKTFKTVHRHLKPGGIFLTIMEQHKETFKQDQTFVTSRSKPGQDINITLIENYFDPDPVDDTYEGTFVFLIRRKGELGIQTDHHRLGIFHKQEWLHLLIEAGFQYKQLELKLSTLAEDESITLFICHSTGHY